MEVVTTIEVLRDVLADKEVAFVPTMGFLHDGHASLIRLAAETGLTCVVSIFVNPAQFNDPRDLETYPRDIERDKIVAEVAGCQVLFVPDPSEMYAPGDSTRVSVEGVADLFEGQHRPGHFVGVATVVAKLFLMVQPNVAFFGEKDWQQCCVISRMVLDLAMPIELTFGPTHREHDGLAMSSRNVKLPDDARKVAPKLFEELNNAVTLLRLHHAIPTVEKRSITKLTKYGFDVDYFSVVDANTMRPAIKLEGDLRIVTAVTIGGVRLIDNLAV